MEKKPPIEIIFSSPARFVKASFPLIERPPPIEVRSSNPDRLVKFVLPPPSLISPIIKFPPIVVKLSNPVKLVKVSLAKDMVLEEAILLWSV